MSDGYKSQNIKLKYAASLIDILQNSKINEIVK